MHIGFCHLHENSHYFCILIFVPIYQLAHSGAMATSSSPLTALHSSFLSYTLSSPSMAALPRRRRGGCRYPRIQAVDLDQNTVRQYHLHWMFRWMNCAALSARCFFSSCDHLCSRLQIVAISVGVVSVAIGIGIPVFYETQIDNAVSL